MDRIKNLFEKENRTKYFLHTLVFLLLSSIVVFAILILGNNYSYKPRVDRASAQSFENPFDQVSLESKSAIVWDAVNNKELFAKNPDTPLPLASLTKVMTALVAYSELPDSSNVNITQSDLSPEGDSGLRVGDTWRASDLRDFTLITSSNDGALALAAAAQSNLSPTNDRSQENFIDKMNKKASEIGLSNSKFFNQHGLDIESGEGGAYGSARDMAVLFQYVLKNYPQILEATRYDKMVFESASKIYTAQNTNAFADEIPGLLASKTGYTDLAGGNLVVAFDPGLNRPIIISVLGSSEEGRFTDTLKLVDASIKYIQERK